MLTSQYKPSRVRHGTAPRIIATSGRGLKSAPLLLLSAILLAGCGRDRAAVSMESQVAADETSASLQLGSTESPVKSDVEPGGTFQFPNDRGGKLLANLLPPPQLVDSEGNGSRIPKRRFAPQPLLDRQELPLQSSAAEMTKLLSEANALRPRPAPPSEESPIMSVRSDNGIPERGAFAPGEKISVSSANPEGAAALPILAIKSSDPPVEDPTLDWTGTAALKSPPPQRTGPAPFVKQLLPDPYENRPAAKVKNTPPEEATPLTGTPAGPVVPVLPLKK